MKIACLLMSVLLVCAVASVDAAAPPVNVRLVTDEAEAVLAILAKRKASQTITEADWQRVFQSEGYARLKKRETSLQRSFEDADFKTFALSEQLLARAAALEETLARWKRVDVTRAGNLALAYLPKDATIHAKIYPVIKPRENSFVFDVKDDPAIFLYLDPASAKPWKGIVPLRSTRADVTRILGNATKDLAWSLLAQGEFKAKPENAAIVYYTDEASGVTIETHRGAVTLLQYEPGKPNEALACPRILATD